MKNPFRIITEREAAAADLTHEGSVYGIPAWLKISQNHVSGVPKVYVLRYLVEFLNTAFETIVGFWPFPGEVTLPHSVRRRINTTSTRPNDPAY